MITNTFNGRYVLAEDGKTSTPYRTPQSVWDEYINMPDQDMREYVPFLREIARGNVLEIGVCQGVSTAAFLLGMNDKNDGHLWSIDSDAACQRFDDPRWTFINFDSRKAIAVIPLLPLDVLLIDGDHSYECAQSDLRTYSPLVKDGGLILMHDIEPAPEYLDRFRSWFPFEETRRAWDEFVLKHSTWEHSVRPGMAGMGVTVKHGGDEAL